MGCGDYPITNSNFLSPSGPSLPGSQEQLCTFAKNQGRPLRYSSARSAWSTGRASWEAARESRAASSHEARSLHHDCGGGELEWLTLAVASKECCLLEKGMAVQLGWGGHCKNMWKTLDIYLEFKQNQAGFAVRESWNAEMTSPSKTFLCARDCPSRLCHPCRVQLAPVQQAAKLHYLWPKRADKLLPVWYP